MTKNGNDGFAVGIAGSPRCTTMGRITVGLRALALVGLLTAGTLEAVPDKDPGHSYLGEVRTRLAQAAHLSHVKAPNQIVAHTE